MTVETQAANEEVSQQDENSTYPRRWRENCAKTDPAQDGPKNALSATQPRAKPLRFSSTFKR